jgi:hypothetical protein
VHPKRLLLLAIFATLVAGGCGGGSDRQHLDVVLLDRSQSFCQINPSCKQSVPKHVQDRLEELSEGGGALRLLLIGNDTGAAFQSIQSDECDGVLRGAAACFEKPTLRSKIFGRSGTQLKAARAELVESITTELANTREITGSSIFDAIMAAERYLNDRRLDPGDRRLLILSDMIEESESDLPPLTCVNVGTPEQNRTVLDQLQAQGRLPDLEYTYVEVLGVGARNSLNGACRARFWNAYFERARADLGIYAGL